MKYTVFVLLFFTLLPLYSDVIHFEDGQTIECRVLKITEKSVTIKISRGTFTFPRKRITKIKYNFEKERSMIPNDDYKAHYNLGIKCLEAGRKDHALSQFLRVEGKKAVPDEVYLKIAEIYLQKDNTDKAVEYYKKYSKIHPNDKLIRKKLEGLTEEDEPTSSGTQKKKKKLKKAVEGLEILSDWRIEKWANPGSIEPGKMISNNTENKILEVQYKSKNSDKTAIRLQYKKNLKNKTQVVFDAYNPAKRTLPVAIAFVTSPGYNWYESKTKPLKPGWNIGISFDLTRSDYKTKATNWKFRSDIKHRENTFQFIILIYNGSREGKAFFDKISFK